MIAYDFNEKYKEYLRKHKAPDLNINIPEFTEWLYIKFQEFIKIPDFNYFQKFAIEQLYKFRESTFGKGVNVIKELEQKLSKL